ncbi:hypothetical protein [Rhodanobacter umsongensis]
MTDLYAVWLGSFIGVLIVPAVMLGIAGLNPNRAWLRVVAGLWAFGGGVYPLMHNPTAMELGGVAAGFFGVVWAILQNRKSLKTAKAGTEACTTGEKL